MASYQGRQLRKRKRGDTTQRGSHVEEDPPPDSTLRIDVSTTRDGITTTKRSRVADDTELPVILKPMPAKKKKPQVDHTEKRQTETAKLTAQFMALLPYLARKVLTANEADASIGTPCACGRQESVEEDGVEKKTEAVREVQCHNCTHYAASCKQCFIDAHLTNPFHWAEVWDHEAGFFRRHNLSSLGHHLQLGHNGKACELAMSDVPFVVTAETGVHSLRIRFCGHWSKNPAEKVGSRVAQLLDARLFPCTFEETASAITFNALKQFQLHHLESKAPAMDYCGALRRMTDNAFTASVPDMYENFMRCAHWWGVLTTRIRLGQEHGIDKILVRRPAGNTVVYCPMCPEPGFNMDEKMGLLPPELRIPIRIPSPCTTAGFFPTNVVLNEHLERAPVLTKKETSNCNYLGVVNNQDRKKWKNMEITGIINVQCSHVYVKVSVDLQYGERYANVDLALALAIRQKQLEGDTLDTTFFAIDQICSYDAACQYSAGIVERFRVHSPDLIDIVSKMRWAVPALHIQGHKEECMYRFGTCYMLATGHFHGESAEFYWPELNQIGNQVTQMSGGRRQDVVALNHNDWNAKKMAKTFSLLLADLRKAEERFRKHQAHFLGLCGTYAVRILREGWLKMKPKPKASDENSRAQYVESVYRRKSTKAPTQLAIYELMLADEAAIAEGGAPRSEVAIFLNEGILIQEEQLRLRKLVARNKNHFRQALSKEIETLRDSIENSVAQWRKLQMALIPSMQAHLNKQAGCPVEKELLGLPSQLSVAERLELKLSALENEEANLREGAIVDALTSVKLVVQSCLSLKDRKKKNSSGVYKNTISQKQIVDAERRRDLHIAKYMAAREALISLGRADGVDDYPPLEVKDTALKSRSLRRQLGDSQITEGAVWAQGGIGVGARVVGVPSTSAAPPPLPDSHPTETQMVRRARRPGAKLQATRSQATTSKVRVSTAPKPTRKEGWLWSFKVGKMTDEELREWTLEGDKIQWFRAEAEMERWREQVEITLADWRTALRSFAKYKETWTALAGMQDTQNIGHIAYAKQKAAMFAQRESEGRTILRDHPTLGMKYGCITDDAMDLVGFIKANRETDQQMQDAVFKAHGELEAMEAAAAGRGGRPAEEEDSDDDWLTDNMGDDEDDEDEDEDEEKDEEDEEGQGDE